MKKIVLQPTEGGYYKFGELPQLIAEALHPDELYPDDYILSVVIWRDDGTEHGQYIMCTPTPDSREDTLGRCAEWVQTPIELTDDDKAHPDRCKWVHWRWHEQRRPENERRYWPSGGELIVWDDTTQNHIHQVVNISLECDWYKDRMREDARRSPDDPRRLVVVDSNLNSLTYTQGAALDRGWVHIDKLNQWGATLDTVNLFSVMQSQPEDLAEQQTTERGRLAHLPAKRRSDRLDAAIQTARVRSAKNGDTTPSGVFNMLEKAVKAGEAPFVRVGQKDGAISLVWVDAKGNERDCTFATLSSRLSRSKTNG